MVRTSSTLGFGILSLLLLPLMHCGSEGHAAPPSSPATRTDPAPSSAPATLAVCPEGAAMNLVSGKVVVRAVVNGANIRAVLDTGAPESCFSSRVPGVTTGKPLSFDFSDHAATIDRAWVDDPRLESLRMPEIDAVIGLDALGKMALTIDYVRERLILEDVVDEPALDACAHVETGGAWVETKRSQHLFVKGTIDGLEGFLLVDSGASLGVLTKSAFATLTERAPRPSVGGFYTPAGLGTFWARVTVLDAMVVGSARVEHLLARTIDDELIDWFVPKGAPFLGCVPSDFFAGAMVTYDLAGNRIRFARERGRPAALPSRLFPTGIELEEQTEGPVRVAGVLDGSAAKEAGIAAGDEIVRIFGKTAEQMDPYARAFALAPSKPGVVVDVVTRRDGVERSVALEGRDLL